MSLHHQSVPSSRETGSQKRLHREREGAAEVELRRVRSCLPAPAGPLPLSASSTTKTATHRLVSNLPHHPRLPNSGVTGRVLVIMSVKAGLAQAAAMTAACHVEVRRNERERSSSC